MLVRKVKKAINEADYGVACVEEAMGHYGEEPLNKWERFAIWWIEFIHGMRSSA